METSKVCEIMSIVEVVPYNPAWPEMFAEASLKIKDALGENCITVHHIGSTSIPGIPAKPIIDMIPVVKDICAVDGVATARMESLGYGARGELGMLFRRYFSNHIHHVHVWEGGSDEITRNLLFRDYLRMHPDALRDYADLKLKLAKQFPNDRYSYTMSKDAFIRGIGSKAGFRGFRIVKSLTDCEWDSTKTFR